MKLAKRLFEILNSALLLAALLVLIVSIFPTKIGSLDINGWLDTLWVLLGRYLLLIVLLAVLAVLNKHVRGTLRYLFGDNTVRTSLVLILSSAMLYVAALVSSESFHIIGNHPLRYSSLGTFLISVGILGLLYRIFWHSKKTAETKEGPLQQDLVLNDRASLSKDQIVVLDNLKTVLTTEERIRSIGVYGNWGVGKSSIAAICSSEITKQYDKIIWVDFEPWKYTSQEALTLGFYESIGRAIEEKVPGMQRSASELLSLANPLVKKYDKTGLFAFLSQGLSKLFGKPNTDPENYIAGVLSRESLRLIVAIDNVERTYEPDRVYRTLQLAHYLKFAKNVTYIFISEKEKLLECVPPHHKKNSKDYLEKFIEYELYTPTPKQKDLRDYLNGLLLQKKSFIPKDFQLPLPNSLIEDTGSYRGILRTFNQFVAELERRFFLDDEYTVDLRDKYILDYFAIKYPTLWLHIQSNKAVYVGKLHDEEYSIMSGFREEDQKKLDTEALNQLLSQLELDETKKEHVTDLLKETFPKVKGLLTNMGGGRSHLEWLRERKVAHPDILDLYFASSEPSEKYLANEKHISTLMAELPKLPEAAQTDLFLDFLRENSESEDSDYLLLLRQEIFSKVKDKSVQKKYIRALFRAYCLDSGYISRAQDNSGVLARIIGMMDEYGQSYMHDKDELDRQMRYFFEKIESYNPHPTLLLRLGLYLLPERGNHFIAFDNWEKFSWLRNKVLKLTDNYYAQNTKLNIFSESVDKEWRFVFYQWALSIRTSSTNTLPRGGVQRKSRVNDYIFSILNNNHKLAYEVLREDLWYQQWSSDPEMWHVDNDKLAPYDKAKLIDLLQSLTSSTQLGAKKRNEMSELLTLLQETT